MRTRTFGLDFDTIAYAKRIKDGSGTSLIPEKLKEINKFVVGIKRLGIWDKMVCWPMRSIHNAGTGSTVYSLGGLGVYNGVMTNSPTWGLQGITFAPNNTTSRNAFITITSFPYNLTTNCSIFFSGMGYLGGATGGGILWRGTNSGGANGYFGSTYATVASLQKTGTNSIAPSIATTDFFLMSMHSVRESSNSQADSVATNNRFYLDGSNKVQQANSAAADSVLSSSTRFDIGGRGSTSNLVGYARFIAVWPTVPFTDQQVLAFYNLYKSTIRITTY